MKNFRSSLNGTHNYCNLIINKLFVQPATLGM
ncbi:hypothetical protein Q428_14140 [Fervidicella metallireducens AeB]|uniref:Uncharacterized protein n=1 Tax=Fervidicella metallireducens AeB TaxID=1403537 RepID=A0A017RRP6_9CLOT|nr:hypothetical protein Q428_14140 [Fervidicella metallireducens AeB]